MDELDRMGLGLPVELIQSRIRSITIQGYWKNIELEVPPQRRLVTVYRGSFPARRLDKHLSFDGFLLQSAIREGAQVLGGTVRCVRRGGDGRLLIECGADSNGHVQSADFVAFATGLNDQPFAAETRDPPVLWRDVLPSFQPPAVRKALIFELAMEPHLPPGLEESLHFIEYGSAELELEMCSLVPKRGFVTVVLVGPSVDRASTGADNRRLLESFLALPHIRKLLPPGTRLQAACMCRPSMVVGTARHYLATRVAVVGDLATTRLYKDGILSACQMARVLAETIVERGIDAASLEEGYAPVIRRFHRDNCFAGLVFLAHRVVFSSSTLSRILYQAVIAERKELPESRRFLASVLWRIASGDDRYERIFWSMLHPRSLGSIIVRGVLLTLRNTATEVFFGLRWEGIGRFTTGVARERLEAKRAAFASWLDELHIDLPARLQFERMYTIRIGAPREAVFEQLGQFGEPDRGFLKPRWVTVRRVAGTPNQPGCVIQYEVFHPRFSFRLRLDHVVGHHLAVYRVQDGFARGGVLLFEVEPVHPDASNLSIYVAFNFPNGRHWPARVFWTLFRWLFPSFVHDVLWNHSLCQFKDIVETQRLKQVHHASGMAATVSREVA